MTYGMELFERAKVACEHCLGLAKDEEVLLVHDDSMSPSIVTAFQYAARSLGVRVQTLQHEPRRTGRPVDFATFAGASLLKDDLPVSPVLLGAVQASQAMIFLVGELHMFFFSPAFERAAQGRRLIRAHYLDEKTMVRVFPSSSEEVLELRDRTERVGARVRAASEARITSAEGTDLTLRLGQYRTNVSGGVVDRATGGRQSIPGGQVTRVPDDNSATGVVVVDRSIGAPTFLRPYEPVTITVERGNAVDIKGGVEAKRLSQWMRSLGDPGLRHLTELGIGTNPNCRLAGVAPPAEDTHSMGCVGVALGTDVHLGGTMRAMAHNDCTMSFATLVLDGETIVEHGRLLI